MIKITHWNVNGLSCEKIIEIQPLIHELDSDIIILSETWLKQSPPYNINLHSYKTINIPRPCKHRKARRNSGGLLIYIKNHLNLCSEVIKQAVDRVWVKFKSPDTLLNEDLYICASYIPPLNSSSHCMLDPPWTDIQREIIQFDKLGCVILIGDFNARIGNFQTNRISKDQVLNPFGLELISLCVDLDLTICNGTYPPDSDSGDFTCHTANGSSCVDYTIVNSSLAPLVQTFAVGDLQAYTDHCPITLTFSTGHSSSVINQSIQSTTCLADELCNDVHERHNTGYECNDSDIINSSKLIWSENNLDKFLEIIDLTQPRIPNLQNHPSVLDIDEVANSFTSQIVQLALTSGFAKIVPIKSSNKPKNKNQHYKQTIPWFDDECRTMKKNVSSKLSAWRKQFSDQDRRKAYYDAKSTWKRVIRRKKASALQKWNREMLIKAHSNPKSFWKALKPKSKLVDNNITSSQWEHYFRELFKESDNDTNPITHHDSLSSTVFQHSNINDVDEDSSQPPPSVESISDISLQEIESSILNLKSGKSPGSDHITNEVLKSLPTSWLLVLQNIYNVILRTGEYPSKWAESIIHPIYKSGDRNNPTNYRGISLISCIGKLFTSILCTRLTSWAEERHLLPKEQFGFQKGKRASDAIFVLHTLAEHQRYKKKKLFCCFVDLKKAFDSVPHSLLWSKLSSMRLPSHIIKVLQSYYSKSTSCVQGHQSRSNFFPTSKGVKQGCNLSPLLFSLFINDLPQHINSSVPISCTNFPSPCLLFADDIVLFSEDQNKLQGMIDSLLCYCTKYHLEINTTKTKILVFGQNPKYVNFQWNINSQPLEVVGKYKYLGTWLNWNCTFTDCISQIYDKANKSVSQLQVRVISLGITNYQVLQHLFKSLIYPILMYNAEIWGLYNVDTLEKIFRKFCKFILRVSQSCANPAILAETGSLPMSHDCSCTVLKYYYRICSSDPSSLTKIALEISQNLSTSGYSSWAHKAITKLQHLGYNPHLTSANLTAVLSRLCDQSTQKLQSDIDCHRGLTQSGGSKLRLYRLIKKDIRMTEPYLLSISNPKIRQAFTKFRLSDHKLLIESG